MQEERLCSYLLAVNSRVDRAFVEEKILGAGETHREAGNVAMGEPVGDAGVPSTVPKGATKLASTGTALVRLATDLLPEMLRISNCIER